MLVYPSVNWHCLDFEGPRVWWWKIGMKWQPPWRNQRCGSLRQWLALVAFGEELASLRLWDRIEHQVTPTDPSPAVLIWYLMRFAYLLNLDWFPKIQNLRKRAKHVKKKTTAPEICPHHPTSFLAISGFLAAPWRSLTPRKNGRSLVKKSQPPGFGGKTLQIMIMGPLWENTLGVSKQMCKTDAVGSLAVGGSRYHWIPNNYPNNP